VRESTASELRSSHANNREQESCILAVPISTHLTIADSMGAEIDKKRSR
jgi:hypothetical protein